MEIKNWLVPKFYINIHIFFILFYLFFISNSIFAKISHEYETYYVQISLEDNLVIEENGEILKFRNGQFKIPIKLITELVGISRLGYNKQSNLSFKLNNSLININCFNDGVLCNEDEVYLDIDKWQGIFQINLKLDEKKMQLSIYPEIELPYLNKYIEHVQRNNDLNIEEKVEDVFTKRLNDGVTIDQSVNYVGNNSLTIDSKVSGNVYNFDTKIYFNNEKKQSINFLKKQSNGFNFLGIRATEVQLLDVENVPGSNLFMPHKLSGVFINNSKQTGGRFLSNSVVYYRERLWQGEIFRDSLLIEKVEANQEGLIKFDNVINKVGRNEYVVRLYGPQGQFEEFKEIYNLKDKFTKSENINYQLFLGENNSKNLYLFRFDQALSPMYILGGTFIEKKINNSALYAFSVDHSFLFSKLNFDLNTSFQANGSSLIYSEFNTVTSLGDFVFKFERNNSFVKFDQPVFDLRTNKMEAILFLNSMFGFKNRILFYDFGNNKRESFVSFLSNYNIDNLNVSTEIIQMIVKKYNNIHQIFRYFYKNSFFQTDITLDDRLKIDNISNIINYEFDKKFNFYFNLTYNVADQRSYLNSGINYIFDFIKVNVSSAFNDNKFSFTSGIFYSLVFSRENIVSLSSKSTDRNSVVKIVSFEDVNYNNIYDQGDLLLSKINFKVNESVLKHPTNEKGEVYFDGLSSYDQTTIMPELNTVEDIYLYPSFISKKIFIRPAMINTLFYPFQRFYSISLRMSQNKKYKLLNELNENILTGRVEGNDFVLEKIRPGKYKMLIGEDDSINEFRFNVVDQDIVLFP